MRLLLRNDPKTRGPGIVRTTLRRLPQRTSTRSPEDQGQGTSTADLFGFASRAWIEGLLNPEKIATAAYFGNTSHKEGDMVSFVQGDEFKGLSATSGTRSSSRYRPRQSW